MTQKDTQISCNAFRLNRILILLLFAIFGDYIEADFRETRTSTHRAIFVFSNIKTRVKIRQPKRWFDDDPKRMRLDTTPLRRALLFLYAFRFSLFFYSVLQHTPSTQPRSFTTIGENQHTQHTKKKNCEGKNCIPYQKATVDVQSTYVQFRF